MCGKVGNYVLPLSPCAVYTEWRRWRGWHRLRVHAFTITRSMLPWRWPSLDETSSRGPFLPPFEAAQEFALRHHNCGTRCSRGRLSLRSCYPKTTSTVSLFAVGSGTLTKWWQARSSAKFRLLLFRKKVYVCSVAGKEFFSSYLRKS